MRMLDDDGSPDVGEGRCGDSVFGEKGCLLSTIKCMARRTGSINERDVGEVYNA